MALSSLMELNIRHLLRGLDGVRSLESFLGKWLLRRIEFVRREVGNMHSILVLSGRCESLVRVIVVLGLSGSDWSTIQR